MKKNLLVKMLEHTLKMYDKTGIDEMIYGNSFVEFGDRNMEVVHPAEMELNLKEQK